MSRIPGTVPVWLPTTLGGLLVLQWGLMVLMVVRG